MTTPITHEEETFSVCVDCNEETVWTVSGDDKIPYCSFCQVIDPDTEEITEREYERRHRL